jgi:hypothetical protein
MKKVIEKPVVREAIQVNDVQAAGVELLIRGLVVHLQPSAPEPHLRVNGEAAFVGDWVLLSKGFPPKIVSAEEFARTYTDWPLPQTPSQEGAAGTDASKLAIALETMRDMANKILAAAERQARGEGTYVSMRNNACSYAVRLHEVARELTTGVVARV